MNKLLSLPLAVAMGVIGAIGVAQPASAPSGGTPMKQSMGMQDGKGAKMMDANGDGMVSKEEFMKHHEAAFDKMKKNSSGTVDMKDMEPMTGGPTMQR
ncbi:hypothetical protein [Methylibium sp.]|jgi:hypothetical protein|uniref:hypothetical protein n=1 Tax=Methylibium sp. TaxID=2067992 RepID=UPI003D11D626